MQNEISVDTARISTINSSEYSRPRDCGYQMGLDKQNMLCGPYSMEAYGAWQTSIVKFLYLSTSVLITKLH